LARFQLLNWLKLFKMRIRLCGILPKVHLILYADQMTTYLFITIDTEEDSWGAYDNKSPSVENIKNIPLLQEIFDKYSAIPTYLINYPVASNSSSIKLLKKLYDYSKCDIGTHCHPWNTPPYEEEPTNYNSFMCNLPEDLINLKMRNLQKTIIENFELNPIVFRAGRWGFDEKVANSLNRLQYKIDTSVTPFCDWKNYSGPAFGLSSNTTFGFQGDKRLCLRAHNCSCCDKFDSCILEIPPTIGFIQKHFLLCNKIRNTLRNKPYSKFHIIGILDRLRILNYRWLSPEISSCSDMINLTRSIIHNGNRFITMFFHSSSLLPGKSPFVRDGRDLRSFLTKIEKYLEFTSREQISCIGMSNILELL